jgi:hypothetical protein
MMKLHQKRKALLLRLKKDLFSELLLLSWLIILVFPSINLIMNE